MIRAYVHDSYPVGGFSVAVSIVMLPDEGILDRRPHLLRLKEGENGRLWSDWEEMAPDGLISEPTMTLDDGSARALLDALSRHYEGAEDTRALRRDYDAERKRVDTLIGHLSGVLRPQ
jgi:hypothetical protein